MFCKNCGNELKEGVKFCSKCGTPIGVIQASENQEVTQAVFQPEAAVSSVVTDKNAIIGKSYIFNNVKVSRYLFDYFLGGEVSFEFQDAMLLVTEQTGGIKDRTTSLPYTDIKAFNFEDKVYISHTIMGITFALLGVLMLFGGGFTILMGILFLVLGILGIVRNILGSILVVNTNSGKTVKIRLKRIKKEKLKEQNEFCCNLNLMIR